MSMDNTATFKEFLLANAAASETVITNNDAPCVTRSSSDTYSVTSEERQAEVVAAIWKQLNAKGCPQEFQLKLLQRVTQQVEQEFRSVKECELAANEDEAIDAQQYDLLKLQKLVTKQLNKLLLQLADNAAFDQLKDFLEPQCRPTSAKSPPGHAVAFVKNKPRKMEDRNVCLERYGDIYQLNSDKQHSEYRFFAVFDGHSGSLAACYATTQLPHIIAQQLLQAERTDEDSTEFYRNAFETAFLLADERFVSKRIVSGTTAVCALITTSHLYIAWVGDSKALLVGKRTQLQLVKPHKPESIDERRRIEAAGGTVIHALGQWRVNGILNVARSIGDYSVETVIAEPDFVDVQLSDAHDFLVLATDGLWDHVAEAQIIDIVYESLLSPAVQLDDIPKSLIEAAKGNDSQDNITVVIVLLKARDQIAKR